MNYKENYKSPFSSFVKKQHKPFKAVIEDEVKAVCANPAIGETKTGDLLGISVYKFKHNKQEYLMAYHVPVAEVGTPDTLGNDPDEQRTPENLYLLIFIN